MTHKYSVGDKVKHEENGMVGEIVGLTFLGLVTGDFDQTEPEYFEPWYVILWDDEDEINIGQESEDSVTKIPSGWDLIEGGGEVEKS